MQYSQEALEEMASKVDLQEYASHTVDFVKRSGKTQFAVCPFHNERTASLAVTPTIYHCFGCGKYGNIYTWIQETENITFDQAVQKVASITNTEIHDYIESDTIVFFKLLKKLDQSQKIEIGNRTILDIDANYNQRFSDEIPQEWINEGIDPDVMRKYEIRIDKSSNRIVYPVYDSDFNLIGVKGRTRFENFKDLKIAKYMNYYSLGKVDYFTGMKQALSFTKQKNEVIIFEGLKSVMKADGWGFHNCVSAETSVINEYQIELLIKMQVRDVVIAFDKDVKYQKIKGFSELLKRFCNVWVVLDKRNLLDEKDSPVDKGYDIWNTLYERRMRL